MSIEIVEFDAKKLKFKCPEHGPQLMVPVDKDGKRIKASTIAGCEKCYPA